MVWHGYEGGPAKKKQKDYWRQNMATWTERPCRPWSTSSWICSSSPPNAGSVPQGVYRLQNQRSVPLRQIALTAGLAWQNEHWTLNGQPYEPEDRSRLKCSPCAEPLQPQDRDRDRF